MASSAPRDAPVGQPPLSRAPATASQDGAARGSGGETGVLSLLQAAGSIAAPVTVATALLYFFGWVRAQSLYAYFGVHVSLLGLTTADYLLRSIQSMFVPLAVGALVAVVALWAHPRIRDTQRRRGGLAITAAPWLVAVFGLAVILWSAAVIQHYSRLPRSQIQVAPYVLAPLGLGVGLGLIVWGLHLRRHLRAPILATSGVPPRSWSQVAHSTLIIVLLSLSVVWAVGDYADATGTGTADTIARNTARQPGVIVYSRQPLQVTTAGVEEQRLPRKQAAYRYRYVGLRLLTVNNDNFLLISTNWFESRTTLILPRSDPNIRFEFIKGENPF
jgi:hypothetical protein